MSQRYKKLENGSRFELRMYTSVESTASNNVQCSQNSPLQRFVNYVVPCTIFTMNNLYTYSKKLLDIVQKLENVKSTSQPSNDKIYFKWEQDEVTQ